MHTETALKVIEYDIYFNFNCACGEEMEMATLASNCLECGQMYRVTMLMPIDNNTNGELH